MKSILFVTVQVLCLALIALTGPLLPASPVLLALELSGLGLGIWAIFAMGVGNFNITPDPFRHTRLVTRGPYRLIRHPMYLALLLTTLPLILAEPSYLRLVFWGTLLIDLLLKLSYEETLLETRLPGYAEYRQRSYRLIPLLY